MPSVISPLESLKEIHFTPITTDKRPTFASLGGKQSPLFEISRVKVEGEKPGGKSKTNNRG